MAATFTHHADGTTTVTFDRWHPRPRYADDYSVQPGDEVGLIGTDLLGTVTATATNHPVDPIERSADRDVRVFVEWSNGVSDNGVEEWLEAGYLSPIQP
jgi:hypothetical protein